MNTSSPARPALERLIGGPDGTNRLAITAVCTAHPEVLRIALEDAAAHDEPILIEATCNQVNQEGGYTGLTPQAFYDQVTAMAEAAGLKPGRLILGGDHLGPNPWKNLPADEAMAKAETMIAAYVRAGFRKLHLDTSMGCAGEPVALEDEVVADRAARLAKVAEAISASQGGVAPVYIVGTEVPPPGGAFDSLDHLAVTEPGAAKRTISVHRAAFARHGLEQAFERVVGLVVQPGVEFGDDGIAIYQPEKAIRLKEALRELPGIAFEAHSTDYQPAELLRSLAADGFAILKVGPALTFAWREALYGLDHINGVLTGEPVSLAPAMEALMQEEPKYWAPYYRGSADHMRVQRHFSYSDRIRYYWPLPPAQKAVDDLLGRLGDRPIPQTLISQHLAVRYHDAVASASPQTARTLLAAAVRSVLSTYRGASSAD
ncbi:class II D-tagatose-bisphosphate aldolase, non-catalytic subunit [Mesorhizobium sp. ES1-1]|uniref:class II D-tagatose-bisphosphate aldolase, non-catalytic subunit n=1 Tax=Mesorhizobium sp. ES1-1 TaxID=2876629 RepID=UPI001CCCA784|nr:class II D-tagatose-bisphosphate aldolase, non-catalytic subunit [Mesorhizobium sp. ES1-1]MBZ9674113.1 class II D-tagatose-bisphosphate aldolase, non-catalytic subunit [Mesorhizobium sp. ES1-1]